MTRLAIVGIALAAAAAFGCTSEADGNQPAPETVTGVIVDVDTSGIVGTVTDFRLKSGNEVYDIHISDDAEYGFPLGHLSEHLASADPVEVRLAEMNGKLYALSIEDA